MAALTATTAVLVAVVVIVIVAITVASIPVDNAFFDASLFLLAGRSLAHRRSYRCTNAGTDHCPVPAAQFTTHYGTTRSAYCSPNYFVAAFIQIGARRKGGARNQRSGPIS
jgi:hypothetical protein